MCTIVEILANKRPFFESLQYYEYTLQVYN